MVGAMHALDQFPLEAEISLTEFRSEETVTGRLRAYHRLRVRRRSDLVGVFLDVDEWHRLVQYVGQLEAESERREDDAARAIVAARAPDAISEPGSANRVAEIDREFERLVAERANAGGTRS
jgi:hypothetical protein